MALHLHGPLRLRTRHIIYVNLIFFLQYSSLWEIVNWKGFATKSELKRIVRYIGHYTRIIYIQGGDRYASIGCSQKDPFEIPEKRKRAKRPKRMTTQRKGDNRLIEITDSLLRSIRLKCTNLESISFESCKIDYYSRYILQ